MADNTAMDILLKELVNSEQFNQLADKNWEAVSKLFPGTTAYQVCLTLHPRSLIIPLKYVTVTMLAEEGLIALMLKLFFN